MRPELPAHGPIERIIRFCLTSKLIVFLVIIALVLGGLITMPFDHGVDFLPANQVPVDAIPDIGENQQIVFTDWPGRSPQDVDDQITYPLTVTLQGTPGVTTIRSYSMFGFSMLFVIFDERVDYYGSRSRLLERLNVAMQKLPPGVTPALGPDATGLGQVFWYTLEGEGFDLQELRSIQDWYVRYALQSTEGVTEVASVGGYVKEYQVDVDPDALRAHRVALQDVYMALERANIDVGAATLEWNGAEYLVRGRGFLRSVADVEHVVVRVEDDVPIYVKQVGRVQLGPAARRGVLDKAGVESVGGVVAVRHGVNPRDVIRALKEKVSAISLNLPKKVLADGRVSQVRIVPFYDRTQLIDETLATLRDALIEEVLITIFVVVLFLQHFRAVGLICINLPVAVLLVFILMKLFGVESNLMSLGGIAIAIGTMVDMGIILIENIVRRLQEMKPGENALLVVHRASCEVGGAVTTAIATTLVSFLPIFALTGAEGKLFLPLAYTKTFALFASVAVALTLLPTLAHLVLSPRRVSWSLGVTFHVGLLVTGGAFAWLGTPVAGSALALAGLYGLVRPQLPRLLQRSASLLGCLLAGALVLYFLTKHWMPLGLARGLAVNLAFVFGLNASWLLVRMVFAHYYGPILAFVLRHKGSAVLFQVALILTGLSVWIGFDRTFAFVPKALETVGVEPGTIRSTSGWVEAHHAFPGMGREFMPSLDEGSYLYMPTVMPHAGIAEALDTLQKQDLAISQIPEVDLVVGKIGRAETAIDPAPISMIETVITYKPEYGPEDPVTGERERLWRDHIRKADDIWDEIVAAASVPGSTSAPRLQPIAARLVMLQSGMRAPMGVKVKGATLEDIERAGFQIAEVLKQVPGVKPEAVIPDRVIGKPYLEIDIDRERIARYGVNVRDVQDVIEIAIGGIQATTTVEGRERYPVRVRYRRELRDSIDALERISVPGASGVQVPLGQLATLRYVRGPQEIKSEDTFLVSYVLFDRLADRPEVDVVEAAQALLTAKIESGELVLPANVHFEFAGSYEGQLRFQKRLNVILPLSLLLIFLILYLQFRNVTVSLINFSGIAVCWAGGFLGLWFAAQPWFLDVDVFGANLRELFHLRAYNLSVPVWVGFIALFGIATDDAVVISTYHEQVFANKRVTSIADIRHNVVEAGRRRIRPCLMTTSTTVLALLPVLTSSGRGADVMIPMSLPLFFGITIEIVTLFTVPVLYCLYKEFLWKRGWREGNFATEDVAGADFEL